MNDTVLKLENVSKKFCRHLKRSLYYGAVDLFKDFLGFRTNRNYLRFEEFWSVNNISFEVRKGEAFALIGTNGSGKSTLLRLIAGIFPPDNGKIYVKGKIGALISLGAGFHGNLSGRENIYLNGAILGLTKEEIDLRINEIVDFAEIGNFIDSPVATYSSGMSVRLGFSIAVHCQADILIVDEVLSVGDTAFTLKCYEKILRFREGGGTLLLVSHNNQLIRNICDRALWISQGNQRSIGTVNEVVDIYEKETVFQIASLEQVPFREKVICRSSVLIIEGIKMFNGEGRETSDFSVADACIIRLYYTASEEFFDPIFIINIENIESIFCISNYTNLDGFFIKSIKGKGFVEFKLSKLALKRGYYFISFSVAQKEVCNVVAWGERVSRFSIYGGDLSYGLYNPYPEWSIKSLADHS